MPHLLPSVSGVLLFALPLLLPLHACVSTELRLVVAFFVAQGVAFEGIFVAQLPYAVLPSEIKGNTFQHVFEKSNFSVILFCGKAELL